MSTALAGLVGRPPSALFFDLDGTPEDSVPGIAVAVDATRVPMEVSKRGMCMPLRVITRSNPSKAQVLSY